MLETIRFQCGRFTSSIAYILPGRALLVISSGYDSRNRRSSGDEDKDGAGCDVCHKPSLPTGNHSTKALANTTANLFSDILVHDIGDGDGISQGTATGAEFRTAPLWGLGQRLFFLHDGSATDLVQAINAHGGEARQVVNNFNGAGGNQANKLNATERQNLINFLRSL
jgi:CxxC motif-containing protein (DUF1111 family)